MEKTKILIVEYNPIVAEDIKTKLANLGYNVTATVYSREKALESVKKQIPDIAMIGISPGDGMNDVETASELKDKHDVSVIYLSSHADDETISRMELTEPYSYIIKPFHDNELKSAIEIAVYKKRSDRKVRESQRLLETTLKSIGDGVITTDNRGNITFMNPVAVGLTGYNIEEVIGESIEKVYRIIDEKSQKTVNCPVYKVLQNGKTAGMENHRLLLTREGKEFPIVDSIAPIKDEKGDITGVVLVFMDQSREHESRRDQLINKVRLEALVELTHMTGKTLKQISDFILEKAILLTKSKIGYLAFLNEEETVLSIYGWSRRAMKECEIADKPIHYSIKETGLWGEAVRQRKPIITNDYMASNPLKKGLPKGHVLLERHMNVPVFDGDAIVAVAGVGNKQEPYDDTDVHQLNLLIHGMWTILKRQRAEEALRNEKDFTDTLLNSQQDTFLLYEPSTGKAIRWNRPFSEISGYSDEEIAGMEAPASYYSPEDLKLASVFMNTILETEGAGMIEMELICKDGRKIPTEYNATLVKDEEGHLKYISALGRDITQRKKGEEEKFLLETQLLQAQKMESIGTLAGGIAHDFNNILSVIIGYSEFIRDGVAVESRLRSYIEKVLGAADRAAELVSQILIFSRQENTEKHLLQPHLVIKETLKMLRATLPSTVEVIRDIDSHCGSIMSTPSMIHQIIVNLFTNGLHSMIDQEGTLAVGLHCQELDNADIKEGNASSAGPFVVLTVTDTGCGMDQTTIDRIFDPYFTTKEKEGGTGLGLALVHGIVAGCKGFIDVKSRVGEGTTFSVYFPAAKKSAVRPTTLKERSEEAAPGTHKRILIVDDELLLIKVNQKRLERQGYQVTATTDSVKALEKFTSQPDSFDMLITDQTMPGLTGAQLSRAVLEIKPSMLIIMCTGHSDTISEEEALASGIKRYVLKPLYGDELLDAVQEVLSEDNFL